MIVSMQMHVYPIPIEGIQTDGDTVSGRWHGIAKNTTNLIYPHPNATTIWWILWYHDCKCSSASFLFWYLWFKYTDIDGFHFTIKTKPPIIVFHMGLSWNCLLRINLKFPDMLEMWGDWQQFVADIGFASYCFKKTNSQRKTIDGGSPDD